MWSGSRISNSSESVSGSAKAADKPTWLAIWTVPAAPKRPSACRLSSVEFCFKFCCFKDFFYLFASLTAAGLPLSDFYRFPQFGLRHRKNLVGQTIRGHCLKTHRVRSACPEHLYQGADCHSDREMQRPRGDPAASQVYNTLWHQLNLVPVLW